MGDHAIGDLAEVLDNLGVFGAHPADLAELCPTGFRRVAISTGPDYYISLQAFAPNQVAYAHSHPDSEEWVMILGGSGQATFGPTPVPLSTGVVVRVAALDDLIRMKAAAGRPKDREHLEWLRALRQEEVKGR